jgi:hypothetical protein
MRWEPKKNMEMEGRIKDGPRSVIYITFGMRLGDRGGAVEGRSKSSRMELLIVFIHTRLSLPRR